METENNIADPQGPVLVQAVPADTIAYADLHKMIDAGSPARGFAGVAQLQESLITKRSHTKRVPEKGASRQHLGEAEAAVSTSNTPAVVEKAPNTDPEKPNKSQSTFWNELVPPKQAQVEVSARPAVGPATEMVQYYTRGAEPELVSYYWRETTHAAAASAYEKHANIFSIIDENRQR